jgi:hypothetical protein
LAARKEKMAAATLILAILVATGIAILLAAGLLIAVREGGLASPAARRSAAASIPFLALVAGAFVVLHR